MSIQKLHYENISGTLVRREGLLSWRCPLCKAEGQSLEVMRTCPECGSKEATLPGAQLAMSVPREAIEKMLTQLMDIAVSNGANSVSMPDEYVEVAAWLCGIPAQPAPSVPDGVAEALQRLIENGAVFGPASSEDALLVARYRQRLLACAPSVPDGWKLVPIEPTQEMLDAGEDTFVSSLSGTPTSSPIAVYRAMLAAATEAKL